MNKKNKVLLISAISIIIFSYTVYKMNLHINFVERELCYSEIGAENLKKRGVKNVISSKDKICSNVLIPKELIKKRESLVEDRPNYR